MTSSQSPAKGQKSKKSSRFPELIRRVEPIFHQIKGLNVRDIEYFISCYLERWVAVGVLLTMRYSKGPSEDR